MDGQRPANALTDSALDRELEAALNVEPSPEFLARVRTRIASEPPSAWGFRWQFATAAAAVAVVVIALTVSLWPQSERVEPREAAAPPSLMDEKVPVAPRAGEEAVPRRAALDAPPEPGERLRGPRDVAAQPVVARIEPQSDTRPFPEVVISEDEKRAFELLLTSIQQDRLPPLPADDANAGAEWVRPAPLQITPVVIEPLPQVARLE